MINGNRDGGGGGGHRNYRCLNPSLLEDSTEGGRCVQCIFWRLWKTHPHQRRFLPLIMGASIFYFYFIFLLWWGFKKTIFLGKYEIMQINSLLFDIQPAGLLSTLLLCFPDSPRVLFEKIQLFRELNSSAWAVQILTNKSEQWLHPLTPLTSVGVLFRQRAWKEITYGLKSYDVLRGNPILNVGL